jgi:hypothetical protein
VRPEQTLIDGDRTAVLADTSFKQRFDDGRSIEFREFSNSFDVVEQVLGRELPL